MTTLKFILRQIIAVFFIAAGFLSMTASAAHASNIFISDTVTADETNENKTIAVWLDSSPASGNVTVTYTITAGTAAQGADYQAGAYTGTLTFASGGSTVQSVAIEVLQDEIDEDLETVTVVLSNPSAGSTIIQSQATLYITDDDLPPSVNVADNSSAEDCSSANCTGGNVSFEVYLSNPSSKTVGVDVSTVDSSATAGADYTAVSKTIQFAPNSTSETFDIAIANDGSSEDNETIIISLSNPINASLDNSTAVLVIEDDDPAPQISIADAIASEDVANVVVSLNAPAGKNVSVTASTQGGTALENTDYAYFTNNITFAPGENSKTISIPINNDTLYENDEQFQVLLSNPSFGTISDNSSLVTIISDDPKPTVSIASSSASEASDNQTATLTLSTASGLDTTVNYATSNGTAIAGSDYVAVSDNVTFSAGETSKTVFVTIISDNTSEENENYTIALTSSDNNSDIGTNASATMLITNDDSDPTLNIAATTAVSEDNTTANVVVSLSAPSGKVVSFNYDMVDGTAVDGQDYTAASGTLQIPAGDNSTLIPVTLLTDNLDEATENFQINITSRTNALQGTLAGTVNISDSASTPPPVVSIADASVNEGAGSVALTVAVTPVSGQDINVDYGTINGTALAVGDYVADNDTLTILAGQSSGTITISLPSDNIYEGDEDFELALSNAVNATLSVTDNSSTITITEDDALPILSVSAPNTAEDNGSMVLTVDISQESAFATNFTLTTSTSSINPANAGNDYTSFTNAPYSIVAGQTSTTINVPIVDDSISEPDLETFTVTVANSDNNSGTGANSSTIVGIVDNDDDPFINIATTTAGSEDNATVNVTISLSATSEKVTSVTFSSSDGTAIAGDDYTATNGSVSIAAGDNSTSIPITILTDSLDEATEQLSVTLTNPQNAQAGSRMVGTVNISDSASTNPPIVSIADTSVNEGAGSVALTVSVNPASGQDIDVDYTTVNGTALAPGDFSADNQTLTIPAGMTSGTITINLPNDSIYEGNETFEVALSNAVNATLSATDNSSTITINEDEPFPEVTLSQSHSFAEGTDNGTVTVHLSQASAFDVSVDLSAVAGTASSPLDFTQFDNATVTFAANVDPLSKDYDFLISDDNVAEYTENFDIILSNPQNASLGSAASTTIQITDTDVDPTISITDGTITEANANSTLTISLSAPSGKVVDVSYSTIDNTTEAGDYTATNGQVSFAPNEQTKTINIGILDDAIDEDNETLQLQLFGAQNASIADAIGEITITDNDAEPTVSIADVSTNSEASLPVSLQITLSSASEKTVRVDYATQSTGSASSADYQSVDSFVSFAPGDTNKTVTVPIIDDALSEGNETFEVVIDNTTNTTVAAGQGTATVTITDDEGLPQISIAGATVSEAAGTATLTVQQNLQSDDNVTVSYSTANGTALAGSDFTSVSDNVTIAAGQTSATFDVIITNDTTDEHNENFTVQLSNPVNAVIGTSTGTVQITDEDLPPSVAIADNASSESSGSITFTVSLDNASEKDLSLTYSTMAGGTAEATDFTPATGTLNFSAGDLSKTISIALTNDTTDEDNETFMVVLGSYQDVQQGDDTAIGTIQDDDNGPVISIADVPTINEVGAVQTSRVSLSEASEKTVQVQYQTQDGTALANNDYNPVALTVMTFQPGDPLFQDIPLVIIQDNRDELDETFEVLLSSPVNATISNTDNSSTVTITDDDQAPTISLAQSSYTQTENGGQVTLIVNLNGPSNLGTSVSYQTNNGTAIAGQDYTTANGTINIPAGNSSDNITISLTDDSDIEVGETFSVVISNPDNATLGAITTAQVTITDDESDPTITIVDNSTAEATTTANMVLQLSNPSAKTITVEYTVTDGTAIGGADYTAIAGVQTLNIAPNTQSKQIPISILTDSLDEDNETITVSLTSATNATIARAAGTLTIQDDDSQPTIVISDFTANSEADGTISVTASLTAPTSRTVTANYETKSGTAVSGSDFAYETGTITFNPNQSATTFDLTLLNDSINENTEQFTLDITNASNASAPASAPVITIPDDDQLSISVSDNLTIANEGVGTHGITVNLSNASTDNVTVDYVTNNITASGADYSISGTGTLTFPAGTTSQPLTITVVDDVSNEGPETFELAISNATGGATISDPSNTITILDDDGDPTVTISDVSVSEADPTVNVAITLSYPSPGNVIVNYTAQDGEATAGQDYTATAGSISFAQGEVTKDVQVALITDDDFEGTERFAVIIDNATNASVVKAIGIVTINETSQALSTAEIGSIKSSLLSGTNSVLRAETQFMSRLFLRNRTALFNGKSGQNDPVIGFKNLRADWDDKGGNFDALFAIDDLNSTGTRSTSWETSLSHSKNASGTTNTTVSTALNFNHKFGDRATIGYLLGFGYGDTSLKGVIDGSISSRSASVGTYASYKVTEGLIVDLLGAKTLETNEITGVLNSKSVNGEYDRNSTSISASIQGVYKFENNEIRPTFSYTVGKSAFKNAYFDVKSGNVTQRQHVDFGTDEYNSLSFAPEFKFLIGDKQNLIRPSGFNLMKVTPKYFCEKYKGDAKRSCGNGFALSLGNHHPSYHYNQDLNLSYENISKTKTYSLNYKTTF